MGISKRKLLYGATWVIALGYLLFINYSRQNEHQQAVRKAIENNQVANNSYTAFAEGMYAEAISLAEEAIRLMPDDALGYYVRGASRLKLLHQQGKHQDLSELVRCKHDLLRAQQLTEKEIMKNFCTEFLQNIAEFEKRASER